MSVGFARAVADGLKYNNVPVSFEPGWETRGNGLCFPNGRPCGLIIHHTGDNYDRGLSVLVNGRSDLSPPLCNCCTYSDGRIHIIAAHCANHAGASGGRSMGILPVTRSFNKYVWGNEIMFPGLKPWTDAQYRSARILAGVICGILGHTNAECIRGHYETSITGKWDPGVGNGKSEFFDMNRFRREVWSALNSSPPISYTSLTTEESMSVDNFPLSGENRDGMPLLCPVGSKSADGRLAWLSATTVGLTGSAWIQVYAQGDTGGIEDWRWTEKDLRQSGSNLLARANRQLSDGVTKILVTWDLSNAKSGVLCLETKPVR
jgi:hypothetical protein